MVVYALGLTRPWCSECTFLQPSTEQIWRVKCPGSKNSRKWTAICICTKMRSPEGKTYCSSLCCSIVGYGLLRATTQRSNRPRRDVVCAVSELFCGRPTRGTSGPSHKHVALHIFLTTREVVWYIMSVLSVCLSDDNFRKSGRRKFHF